MKKMTIIILFAVLMAATVFGALIFTMSTAEIEILREHGINSIKIVDAKCPRFTRVCYFRLPDITNTSMGVPRFEINNTPYSKEQIIGMIQEKANKAYSEKAKQLMEDEIILDIDGEYPTNGAEPIKTTVQSSIGFCAVSGLTKECPYGLSGGSGTRCYQNIEKTSWFTCSSGWVLN